MTNVSRLMDHFRKSLAALPLDERTWTELKNLVSAADLAPNELGDASKALHDMALGALGKGNDPAVMEWLRVSSQFLNSGESSAGSEQVHFSPGPDCLQAILRSIQGARRQMDICVFTISDDRIRDAILLRKTMGTKIRILTDNEKLLDDGSDITALDKAGIEIRVDRTTNHMHHKYALFDNRTVITGSYNWTRSAEAYNHENILLTQDPSVVGRFSANFESLWREMKPF